MGKNKRSKKSKKRQRKKAYKSKPRRQSSGLIGMMTNMESLAKKSSGGGWRAQIIDTPQSRTTMAGHEPPIKESSLMGGKKLVMSGKDKGKII